MGRVRGDEIASHEHNGHVADRHGDPGKDQTGQQATEEPTGGLKVQEEEARAHFPAGRPSVCLEERERRSSGGGEKDEGRSRSLEAGGDRTRQLRLRHQGGRGGQLLTRARSRLPKENHYNALLTLSTQ